MLQKYFFIRKHILSVWLFIQTIMLCVPKGVQFFSCTFGFISIKRHSRLLSEYSLYLQVGGVIRNYITHLHGSFCYGVVGLCILLLNCSLIRCLKYVFVSSASEPQMYRNS